MLSYVESRQRYELLVNDFSRKCETTPLPIDYLLTLKNSNRIDTELDIQRGYQWDEPRQQEMWNTLLIGAHIPEFHAIKENGIYRIIDGKQRLLTIFKIISNEISLKKSSANSELQWMFFTKGVSKAPVQQLLFKNLPDELKNKIFNTTLLITTYEALDRDEQILMFKKINNGKNISDFAKSLCSNFFIRKDGTSEMFKHKLFKDANFGKNKEAYEIALVRYMILSKAKQPIDLSPKEMERHYPLYDQETLSFNVKKANALFDRIENFNLLSSGTSWKTFLPVILTEIEMHPELTSEQIKQLFITSKDFHSGRGQDLLSRSIGEKMATVETAINDIKTKIK